MAMASSVEIRKVDKFYGPFQALKSIDMSIAPSKVTCLIGPSGSGKSTLLRCINFLEEYDAGEIRIDGELIGYRSLAAARCRRAGCARCAVPSAWCSSSSISGLI